MESTVGKEIQKKDTEWGGGKIVKDPGGDRMVYLKQKY